MTECNSNNNSIIMCAIDAMCASNEARVWIKTRESNVTNMRNRR